MSSGEQHRRGGASSDDPAYDLDEGFVVDTRQTRRETEPVRAIPQTRPAASPARQGDQPSARPSGGATRTLPSGDPRGGQPTPHAAPAAPKPRDPRPPVSARVRRRRILLALVVAVTAWLVFLIFTPLNAWSSIGRVDAVPAGDRPAPGKGANYLLVGSDSRAGLTDEQAGELSTGTASEDPGQRTDSMMLMHVPDGGGQAALISIPRDSYVPIAGHGKSKINAAYAWGGPKLLVDTVEQATGLRIDGYVEIGFGGFASVVDSLGGVDICVPFNMNDPLAGINLKKGCQSLDGKNALGFVRARYSDPRGDIGRAERQRMFLSAIMKKAAAPGTVLLPWQYWGFTHAVAAGLRMDEGMSPSQAKDVFLTMKSISGDNGISMVVPIADAGYRTSSGIAVKWDTTKALELFHALRDDQPLTAS